MKLLSKEQIKDLPLKRLRNYHVTVMDKLHLIERLGEDCFPSGAKEEAKKIKKLVMTELYRRRVEAS